MDGCCQWRQQQAYTSEFVRDKEPLPHDFASRRSWIQKTMEFCVICEQVFGTALKNLHLQDPVRNGFCRMATMCVYYYDKNELVSRKVCEQFGEYRKFDVHRKFIDDAKTARVDRIWRQDDRLEGVQHLHEEQERLPEDPRKARSEPGAWCPRGIHRHRRPRVH